MPAVTDTAPWRLGPEPSAPADPAPAPQATTPVAAAPVNSTAVTPPQPPVAVIAPAVAAGPPQLPATAVPSPPAPAVAAAPPPQPVAAPAAPQRKAGPATLIGVTPPPYAVAAAVPAQPAVAEPALARAPATPHRPEPQEDPRIFARAVIEEALVPVHNAFRDLQRRIEEIERRPLATAATVGAAHSPAAATAMATAAALQTPYRAPQETYPGAGGSMAPIPVTLGSRAPRPPILDIGAIERDTNVVIDGALDGRRRKTRLAITFVLLLLVVFGGLFAALAYSYQPHTTTLETPPSGGRSLDLDRA